MQPPEPETLTPLPERLERALNAWAASPRHQAGDAPCACVCGDTGWLGTQGDEAWRPCSTCNRGAYERWVNGCFKADHPGCPLCHPRSRRDNTGSRPDRERVPRQTDHRAHEWDENEGDLF